MHRVSLLSLLAELFLSFYLGELINGIQQLNEWTDILSQIEQYSSSLDNNSFELKTQVTDGVKSNTDMAEV